MNFMVREALNIVVIASVVLTAAALFGSLVEERSPRRRIVLGLGFVVVLAAGWVGSCSSARADTPITACWSRVCVGPEVAVSLLAYNLATRKVTAGVLPVGSIGYGAHSVGDWWAAGLYLSAQAGGSQPGYMAPAVLVRLFRAFTVGAQLRFGEAATQWSLLAGAGVGL